MMYLINFVPSRGLFDPSPQVFINAIETEPTRSFWHYLRDTWIIVSSEVFVNEVYERLKPHMLEKDRLLIVSLNAETNYQGWLDQDAWEWLTTQIQSGAYYQQGF